MEVPLPLAVVDFDGRVVRGNAPFRAMFAWDPETHPVLTAREIGDFLDTSWPEFHLAQAREGVTSTQPIHHRFRRLDGGKLVANLRTWPSFASNGSPIGMVAVFTSSTTGDANQYRLLWQALEEQHELMVEWALDGTVLFCNRACRDFFGWPETVVGRNLDEIYTWTAPQSRVLVVGRVMAEVPVEREQRVYENGRVVEWADTPVRDELGNVMSIFSMGQEITDRIRIQEALRISERRNRVMVTHIQDTVVLLDAQGVMFEASSTARPDLGYASMEPFLGGRLLQFVHADDSERMSDFFDALLAEPDTEPGWAEFRAMRADGTYAWLEVAANNLLEDPDVGAVVLTVRNIDQRKRLEIELEEGRRRIQEELRQRLELVAQVGHELRNPLQALAAFSEHLRNQHVNEETADDVEAIARLTGVMRRVVDDLLDASQLDLGTISVRSEVVDVAPIIDDAVFVARQLAHESVEVAANPVPAELRHVVGDTDRVRQALTNLLSNACKHTRQGSITVDLSSVDDQMVRISVRDTGSGISADDVERLFRPFERGRDGKAPDTPGIGLGLAIVTGIASAMGGSAGAAPLDTGGSVFWIDVPHSASAPAVPIASAARREVPHRRVLVIDDEPLNRMAAKFMLSDLGAEVATAVSGEQALQMVSDHQYDTLFVDLQLPGISGLEFTRQLRARGGHQPVVAIMTGDVADATRSAAAEAGADAFVPKPSTTDDLIAVLRRTPRS